MEAGALFAHVNDAIRRLATEGHAHETWEFLCECPDLDCHAIVTLTLQEFDERRAAYPPLPVRVNHGTAYASGNGNGSVDGG